MVLPSLPPARATLLALLVAPSLVFVPGRALAQSSPTPAERSAHPGAPPPAAVHDVDVRSVDPALPPERVRAAVLRELDVSGTGWSLAPGEAGTSDASGPHGSRIEIEIHAERRAVVSLHGSQGPTRTREIVLPEAPDSAMETLALLSASLVRQDASDLAAALDSSAEPSEPTAPARPTAPAKPTAPANAASEPQGAASDSPPSAPEGEPSNAVTANEEGEPSDATDPAKESVASAKTEPSAPTLQPFPANLSLAYPLALVPDSEERRFHWELGLFYSRVGGIDGFAVNPIALRIEQDTTGMAVSGVWLDAGSTLGMAVAGVAQRGRGDLHGMAVAGAADLRTGNVDGAQIAGAFTLTEGTIHGLQTAGAVGLAEDVLGAQIAGAASFGSDVEGAQIAGAASFGSDVEGAQIAGAFGAADSLRGLQVAGAVTLTERLEGAQIAGVFAGAEQVLGAQIATVNVAGPMDGAQIGLVNIGGRVRGAQIGLVNIADEIDGAPLGLVNVNDTGRNQVVAWHAGSRLPYNVALKYMHGPVYTLVAFGFRPGDEQATLAPGAGLGGRIPLWKSLFAEVDALWQNELTMHEPGDDFTDVHVVRGRAALGVEVLPELALFAGGGPLLEVPGGDEGVEWEPHFFGGVQVF